MRSLTVACTKSPLSGAPQLTSRPWCLVIWERLRHRRLLHPRPVHGENVFYGEYLVNAQGEDVVAGIRTPQPLSKARATPGETPMEAVMPAAYTELLQVRQKLEQHYRDMQDIEFTIQKNRLFMLQTRNGKRTGRRQFAHGCGYGTRGTDRSVRSDPSRESGSTRSVAAPDSDPRAHRTLLAKGLPASPGAASGAVVFSADEAESRAAKGEAVVLVRIETSPEDIHGMHAARGIVTTRGGMTSHAAVVARGMGRPCVAGAGGITVTTMPRPSGLAAPRCRLATSLRLTVPPERSSSAACQ